MEIHNHIIPLHNTLHNTDEIGNGLGARNQAKSDHNPTVHFELRYCSSNDFALSNLSSVRMVSYSGGVDFGRWELFAYVDHDLTSHVVCPILVKRS